MCFSTLLSSPALGYSGSMSPRKHIIIRYVDPELVDAEYTTDSPEEADELLEMAHARRPWARVTIYDDEGLRMRWVHETDQVLALVKGCH